MKLQMRFLLIVAPVWFRSLSSPVVATAELSQASLSRRSLQESPTVGIFFSDPYIAPDEEQTLELTTALEQDPQITVEDTVEIGALDCESLVAAEDAPELQFAISVDEIITAEQTSYITIDGQFFEDGVGRNVWAGVVVEAETIDHENSNRTVCMTWADECSTETFIFRVVTEFSDGSTSVLKTVPCDFGDNHDLCLVTVSIKFLEETQPATPTTTEEAAAVVLPSSTRKLYDNQGRDELEPAKRKLQSSEEPTVITVMYLYTPRALEYLGNISVLQMESFLTEGLASTNMALGNSGINAQFSAVYMGLLPYTQEERIFDALAGATNNEDVNAMRDLHDADLVQLVGGFDDQCGIAWSYSNQSALGYSVAAPNCFYQFTHTHEFGHNLGCNHNREDAGFDAEYAHGHRNCDGPVTYRTIMSYQCSDAPRINYFSNPDVNYLGIFPTGTETEDCSRTIMENMDAVAAYRPIISTPAPAPTPTSSATNFGFLGCYADNQSGRVLSGEVHKEDSEMTTEACADICAGYTYFGTQFGDECWCGISTDEPDSFGPSTCDMECSGDDSEFCGGRDAISVYEFHNATVSHGSFLGCYTDDRNDRVMVLEASLSTMSTELCSIICSGSSFYGTQFGSECWCGDESTDFEKHGESTACTYECAGDPSETCGGFNAVSLYQF